MVRKSERTKQKAPEKPEVLEKKKPGRPPKRKKKSESDSEPEAEADPKEVGDISESKQAPPGASAEGEKGVSRRTRKHRNTSESTDAPPPPAQESEKPEKNPEWKEDPGFWGQEDSAPAADSSKAEEATTWKIQSSNGSGGEIQKLKICRQRVANESNDSSSPVQTKDSPRRKKKSKHADDNTESGGDVSSSNETRDELKTPTEAIIIPKSDESSVKDATEVDESKSSEIPQTLNETVTSESSTQEIPVPQEEVVEDSKVTEEVEVETSSRRSSQDSKDSAGKKSRKSSVDENVDAKNKSRKSSVDEQEKSESKSRRSSTEEEPQHNEDNETRSAIESIIGVQITDETAISESNEQVKEDSTTDKKPEPPEEGKGEKKLLTKVKVTVNSEDAMDEIAKKLNERAARFSRDERKQRPSTDSLEPKSPREEGELTPVPEQIRKPKHTTIIINKPKEITSQPTRLKRNTDELPPTERKRRILLKSKTKEKEEDAINISSQSLMLLVPEVKTITPEQVAAFPLDDDELTKFELEDQSEELSPKVSKKKIDLQPKEVEVRVENDTRQVTKKKQIVIESTDMSSTENKSVGPKLPTTQENHRVVRKISLVNDETKKVRRSPSPSEKSQTEVLFITNLVRPFTVPQLRELLARTGTIAPNGFYIDKIKSKCYVKYTDVEMAVETRHALNGVRWPVNNPKTLKVEFVSPEEMTVVQQMADDENSAKKVESSDSGGWLSEQAALKPQRRVTTAVREWDMGKIGAGPLEEKRPANEWRGAAKQQEPVEQKRRPASPVEAKYEPTTRKIKKRDSDAPARLLDDLFRKTKATPCIYWLPLTAAQIAVKEEMRRQHMAENERRLAELRKTDHSRRDNRERDHDKSRDRRKK